MSRRSVLLSVVLLACAMFGVASADTTTAKPAGAPAASVTVAAPVLTGDLPRVVAQARPDERIPVSIVLRDQLHGTRLIAGLERSVERAQRRAVIVERLTAHAARTQARLRAQLGEWEQLRRATAIRPLWIGNIIGAELTRKEIELLGRFPEVDHINWNPKRDVFLGSRATAEQPTSSASLLAGVDAVECGVSLMDAPRVWNELGVTGQGAVVAVIDTGVCPIHSDITSQIWINPGEDLDHDGVVRDLDDVNGVDDDGNGFVDDLSGWDFANNDRDPDDDHGHGSHCAGTVAGDGTAGTQTGMAPDARIMAVKVGITFADEVDVWNAMQYAAANGADVISMSLGWPHSVSPDRATWRTNCGNTIDAGTTMVIAAGNEGEGIEPDNVRTPGDVPRVITVGAVDCADAIAWFSSRGPVSWQGVPPFSDFPYPPGLVKPDVSAPGVNTESHDLCGGYTMMSGTSMATPHVAGAVALMVSRDPSYLPDDIKLVLEETAIDLGAPGKDNLYGAGRVDAFEAVASRTSPVGRISIREGQVSCHGSLTITVADSDLQGAGTITVRVDSPAEPLGEPVVLTETRPNSGAFRGSIGTASGAGAPDGVLQTAHAQVLTARYVDANDGQGGTNIPRTDTARADCAPPQFVNVRAEETWLDSTAIRWNTDEPADSGLDYGAAVPPSQHESAPQMVLDHEIYLFGLTPCTTYYYAVSGTDALGNGATATNGGAYFRFETLGDFGNGPQACHRGTIVIDSSLYGCNGVVSIQLQDNDLNLDSNAIDSATVTATSSVEIVPETVTLLETDLASGLFTGSIELSAQPPAVDGKVSVADLNQVTITYLDSWDGSGGASRSYRSALVDCRGPQISNVRVENVTDQRGTIRFDTDEWATDQIEWGPTSALGNEVENVDGAVEHGALINRATSCAPIYFRLRAFDTLGNETVSDLAGVPNRFLAATIPGLYYRETFEGPATGWTLPGEWEIGAPQGLGQSSSCGPDPISAYNHDRVLGHDLSGLGLEPGGYEANVTGEFEAARTPTFNASTWTNTKLILYSHLNVESEDDAQLMMLPEETMLLQSQPGSINEWEFQYRSWDLSALADGNPQVWFEFRQDSNDVVSCSGWNVDDFILKNGALPDYGPCGGCAAGPAFAGVASAVDNNACAATGVQLSWVPPVGWGSGAAGSYSVYRGPNALFVPSASNRVATGITASTWVDAAVTPGTHYYLVRAENNETCSNGPANGGVTDGNSVHLAVEETTTRPTPAEVAALRVRLVGGAHLQLTWAPGTGAARYRVLRSGMASGGFAPLGDATTVSYEDLDQGANLITYFYLVHGVNACGVEGP